MEDGPAFSPVGGGDPAQGQLLGPSLSNLVLDDIDKELKPERGHRFCRYATIKQKIWFAAGTPPPPPPRR